MPFGARARASVIELAGGDMTLTLAPNLGAAALSLAWRGQDILRPAPVTTKDVMRTASFPLAPFANRIANGRFRFDGQAVSLKRNYGGEKHPLHGYAWLMPWRTEETGDGFARLTLRAEKSAWPWAFSCERTIRLDGTGAHFGLALRNESKRPMPAGIGFHPAFARPRGSTLKAHVSGVWRTNDDMLPTHFDPFTDLPDMARGAALDAAPLVDHCHPGWDGAATLLTPTLEITLAASNELGFLHLYMPQGADFLCIEPVSAMPDAVNRADTANSGLRVLAPGETLSGWMRISAAPRGG
ncbi:MAG: aldose 1-epimerase [Hyphomonadaceae bacterium]|nr:aldose 1-epimerase [Hyphomonadaceae bacterium]